MKRPPLSEAVRAAARQRLALALAFRRGALAARKEGRASHASEAARYRARILNAHRRAMGRGPIGDDLHG